MAGIAGKWKLATTEGFDEYMQALGVSFMLRKIGNTAKPSQEIKNDGSKWEVNTYSTFKNTHVEFEEGVEFEENTVDGRKVQTKAAVEGDKITLKQVSADKDKPDSTIVRELTDPDSMQMTLVAHTAGGDVTCKRTYKRE